MAVPPYYGAIAMTEESAGRPDDLFSLDSPLAQQFFFEEADEKRAELQLALEKLSREERLDFVETYSRFIGAALQSSQFSSGVKKVLLEDRVKLKRAQLGKLEDKRASARLVEVFASLPPPRNVERESVSLRKADILAKGVAVVIACAALYFVLAKAVEIGTALPVDVNRLQGNEAELFKEGLEHLLRVANTTTDGASLLEAATTSPTREILEVSGLQEFVDAFKIGQAHISDYCNITNGGLVDRTISSLSSVDTTNRDAAVFHITDGTVWFDCVAGLTRIPLALWRGIVLPVVYNVDAMFNPPVWAALKSSAAFMVAISAVSWRFSRDYVDELNDPKWSLCLMGSLTLLFAVAAHDFYLLAPVSSIVRFGEYAAVSLAEVLTGIAVSRIIENSPLKKIVSGLAFSGIFANPVTGLALSVFGATAFTGFALYNVQNTVKYETFKMLLPYIGGFASFLLGAILAPAADMCRRGMSSLYESACSENAPYRMLMEQRVWQNATTEEQMAQDLRPNRAFRLPPPPSDEKKGKAQLALLHCDGDIEAAARLLTSKAFAFSI